MVSSKNQKPKMFNTTTAGLSVIKTELNETGLLNFIDLKSSKSSESGDFWGYTSIKRNSYFFNAFTLGKRTTNTCRKFMKQFSEVITTPTMNNKLLIYTDGNFDYKTTILEIFGSEIVD